MSFAEEFYGVEVDVSDCLSDVGGSNPTVYVIFFSLAGFASSQLDINQ